MWVYRTDTHNDPYKTNLNREEGTCESAHLAPIKEGAITLFITLF